MLANPVVIPAYADPFMWALAVFAMSAEIVVTFEVLRRCGLAAGELLACLLVGWNTATWTAFLLAIEALDRLAPDHSALVITGLELAVIVVEGIAIWAASHWRRLWAAGRQAPLGFGRSLAVSTLGNAVSIAMSIGIALLIQWALRR